MSSIADDNMLDSTFLTNLQNDDQDILDEFLDQRVYDSLGANTPVSGLGPHDSHQPPSAELFDNFYTPTQITDNNNSTNNNNPSSSSNNHADQSMKLESVTTPNPPNSTTNNFTNNEYLYIDPYQYQSTQSQSSNSVYESPYNESKPAHNSAPNSTSHTPSPHSHRQFTPPAQLVNQPPYPDNNVSPNTIPHMSSQLCDYDIVRDELSKLKFGNHDMNTCPPSVDVPHPSYLDFSPAAMERLPYKLQLSELPTYSRVETQIKLKFQISPPPPQILLHIPQDLISKNKFCLNEPVNELSDKLKDNLLYLDTFVLTSNFKKSCNICPRCIKREQKRASRRKSGHDSENANHDSIEYNSPNPSTKNGNGGNGGGVVKNNPNSWADEKMMKKAIIFNCKEIVSFPPPNGLNNDSSKSLEVSARIICYCRHHKESEGFKLLFVIKNARNEVVAKQLSTPIMIMDRKKNTANNKDSNDVSFTNDNTNSNPNKTVGIADSNMHSENEGSASVSASNSNSNTFNMRSKPSPASNLKSELDPDIINNTTINHNTIQPLSPNSIDESASEILTNTDTDNRGTKRKKLSVDDSYNISTNPMFNGSITGFSPTSNSDTNTSATNFNSKPSMPQFQHQPLPSGIHPPPNRQFGMLGANPSQQQQQQLTQPGSTMGSVSGAPSIISQPSPQQQLQQSLPSIQRIIPAQGPIRGGIEVTLLGFNFRPGLAVKFGSNNALATHCWSETTIVTYLPPASQPGQVLVSFENHENMMLGGAQQQQVFTYTDDTDRQLIELALQIVGLKMNGKLEDAKNIAKRIVGSDTNGGNSNNTSGTSTDSHANSAATFKQENIEWYDSAHKAVERLTRSDLCTQDILINFLSLVDLPNCPIIIPNWQLTNKQGQTLLHLATLKNYDYLVKFLITHGCKVDVKDNQGLTSLFLASMCGHRELIQLFIDCKSNWNLKLSNDKFLKDYCDLNVLDMFSDLGEKELESDDFTTNVISQYKGDKEKLTKSISLDSLNSMFTMNYGRHISKMVIENSVNESAGNKLESGDRHIVRKEFKPSSTFYKNENNSSDFADSEHDSNDDFEDDYNQGDYTDDMEDTEDDYEDYDYSDYDSSEVESLAGDFTVRPNASVSVTGNTADADESSNSTIVPLGDSNASNNEGDEEEEGSSSSANGLWQKVKNVFNNDQDNELPSYDDLFPFGPSSFHSSKPKTSVERNLNELVEGSSSGAVAAELKTGSSQSQVSGVDQDDVASDSSEDMVVSYINRPRKTVENDKMLLFFWFPMLITIVGLFMYISIMGYRVETIENFKHYIRSALGNLMVGNERIGRVFKNSNEQIMHATRRILNEDVAA